MTWSRVAPYTSECVPQELFPNMPPRQHRLLVDVSGENSRPYGFRARFSSSRTTPGCTRAQRSSALISRILFQPLMSTTIPFPTTWPASEVPAARGIRQVPRRRASATSSCTSASVSGYATPSGISR